MNKEYKKILVLLIMMIMPVFVSAAGTFEYNSGNNYAKEYIKKGNFKTTYERYIKLTDRSHYIDQNEYEKTKNSNSRSYLFDGVEFWTSTSGSSDHYYVSHTGLVQKATSSSSKYNVKDTEYVKEDVKVRGRGTYANPWTFDPMYEVKVITDGRYGHIVDESGEVFSKTVFASRGENVSMKLEKKEGSGYKYITNNCGATYSNGYLTISNVTRNMTCNVIFGIGKFKVALNGASPDKVVSNYRDNFYKYNDDMNLRDIITKITPPSRIGYLFNGYKYNDIVVVNPDGSLNRAATNSIYEDIELNPSYNVSAPTNVTISGSSTKIYNSSDTTLTCATTTTYAEGTKLFYSFGYSTTSTDTPGSTSWSTPSESNTYTINKNLYMGDRYYSCRIYAQDNVTSAKSPTTASVVASSALVRYNNATITFNANGGSLSETSPLYTRSGVANLYSGIRNSTTATAPTASKTGYTFSGWYTAASGGSKVINANGTIVSSNVSGYTNSNTYSMTTDKTLYAQFTGNAYTLEYDLDKGSYGTNHPKSATYGKEFTVNNPSKTVTATFEVGSGITCKDGSKTCSNDHTKSANYTFVGWDITSMDTVTHYYGSKKTSKTSLSKIKETKFKNLRSTSGTVTFTAKWDAPTMTLPTITKSGFICKWKSSNITDKASGGKYTPNDEGGAIKRTFTASCKQDILKITLNKNGGSGGSDYVYEKYNKGVYKDSKATKEMTTTKNPIIPPSQSDYAFTGYYTEKKNGKGKQLIDKYGFKTDTFTNTYFDEETSLYAHWEEHGVNDHNFFARGSVIFDSPEWYLYNDEKKGPYYRAYGIYCTECHMSAQYYVNKYLAPTERFSQPTFVSPVAPYHGVDGWVVLDDRSEVNSYETFSNHISGYFPVVEKPK